MIKIILNPCNVYLSSWFFCILYGNYQSGPVSAFALLCLIFYSLMVAISLNMNYHLPYYFKWLNIFLVTLSIYGIFAILDPDVLTIVENGKAVKKTNYILYIYKSLLPIYVFYYFTVKGWLNKSKIIFWIPLFVVMAISTYFATESIMFSLAEERGAVVYSVTNNTGYMFLAFMPFLSLFNKKNIIPYFMLLFIMIAIFLCMKRGAIIIGVLCGLFFLYRQFLDSSTKKRFFVIIISICALLILYKFVENLLQTDAFFYQRVQQTLEGNTSHRDEIASSLIDHYLSDTSLFQKIFGCGAMSTVKFAYNFAHNDWLEILTNQGIFGILIYLAYWGGFFRTCKRSAKYDSSVFLSLSMLFIIYFTKTMFSMSYDDMPVFASCMLGYSLGQMQLPQNQDTKE